MPEIARYIPQQCGEWCMWPRVIWQRYNMRSGGKSHGGEGEKRWHDTRRALLCCWNFDLVHGVGLLRDIYGFKATFVVCVCWRKLLPVIVGYLTLSKNLQSIGTYLVCCKWFSINTVCSLDINLLYVNWGKSF